MVYRWRYHDESGRETSGPEAAFTDQDEAEDWLGGSWRELLGSGVHAVTLVDDELEVYGPMSLLAE